MASEQMSRRRESDNATEEKASFVGKDRVPKMTSHFENLAANKGTSESDNKEKSHEFVSLADKVNEEQREKDFNVEDKDRSGKREEPSLEEISKLRGQAQQNSSEAIRAAEERYAAAERGSAVKDSCLEKGQTPKDYVVEKAAAAAETGKEAAMGVKDRAVAAGWTAAETGKEAAVGVKDRAVAAGWTAAHYSTEKTVAGTTIVARAVKGAAEKVVDIAGKPIVAARDAAFSAGESVKDYTSRKKEEATRDLGAKQRTSSQKQETESESVEKMKEEEAAGQKGQSGTSTTMLGAIGETIVEIAQTTKDLVIGEDKTRQQRDEIKPHSSSDQSY